MILDVFGIERIKSVESHDHRPRGERRSCALSATLAVDDRDGHCMIQNISEGGLGLLTDAIVRLRTGQRILVTSEHLGSLVCIVRWVAHPRYGVEFDSHGRKSQAVRDYYDSLPANPG
jgi:hypothetical protein